MEKGRKYMGELWTAIQKLWEESGFARLFNFENGGWKNLIMIGIACVLIYLAIKKQFEPLLLLPIAFGMLLVNLPLSGVMDPQQNSLVPLTAEELKHFNQGIYDQMYQVMIHTQEEINGVMTVTSASWQHFDQGGLMWYLYQGVKFGIYPPLIFLGIGAMTDFGPLIANPRSFLLGAAAQLGIFATFIGARALGLLNFPELAFTNQEAASIAIIGGADGPTAIYLTSKLAPHLLGAIVGSTANAATFLQPKTLLIIVLGLLAFCFGTAGGVLFGKLMYVLTKGKVNPLIGSAGVSAVPMAARVAQKVGQQENPSNFLLMHAMGPNVAGVIGSAVAAGILLSLFG